MKTLSFGCEKVAVVRNILQFFDANSNAWEEISFARTLKLLTSAEYTFENQITEFGQKSNPDYSGDDVHYETVDFTDEMHEYFTKNLASICEAEFEVEDAKTLIFIF
jgi:hypothetical protein